MPADDLFSPATLERIAQSQVAMNFKAPGCSARAAKAASKYAGVSQ